VRCVMLCCVMDQFLIVPEQGAAWTSLLFEFDDVTRYLGQPKEMLSTLAHTATNS
jgi:hypothetical protein